MRARIVGDLGLWGVDDVLGGTDVACRVPEVGLGLRPAAIGVLRMVKAHINDLFAKAVTSGRRALRRGSPGEHHWTP